MTFSSKGYFYAKSPPSYEKGSVMLEFAFVFPILVIFTLSGYNLMRDMEVNMIKRDFSRSLTMSYQCTFKQSNVAKSVCIKDTVKNLTTYAAEKSILKKYIPAVPTTPGHPGTPAKVERGNFAYSIHTYTISDIILKDKDGNTIPTSINESRDKDRNSRCLDSASILNANIIYAGGYPYDPTAAESQEADGVDLEEDGFIGEYSLSKVKNRAKGQPIKIKDLFPIDSKFPNSAEARKTLCLNGSITIAEVEFKLDKLFKFGRSPNSQNRFYEVSFL